MFLSGGMAVLVIAVLMFTSVVLAGVFQESSFQAASNGVSVSLHWITDDESNVDRFEVERRTGTDGQYTSIGVIATKGASLYEFNDNSAFRKVNTLYQYRLVAYFKSSSLPVVDGPVTVTHTVSGVRRTWGSIKAMFR